MSRLMKSEIINKVSDETGYSRRMVEAVINSLLGSIVQVLSQGNEVQFTGFGTFELKKRAARIGRNPRTNEPIPIPARIVPAFKPGNWVKNMIIRLEKEV